MKQTYSANYLLYLIIAFIEGGAVMSTEIIGAKMPAPFFGSSLSVWTAILAVTLFGLTVGYFIGGIISEKKNNPLILNYLLIAAALFIGIMPYSAESTLTLFQDIDLIPAVVLSTIVFLFPPMFFLGTISPLIIKEISCLESEAGKSAGTVLAVSTSGGIIFLMITGFYLIAEIGLIQSSITVAIILAAIPVTRLLKNKQYGLPVIFVLLFSYLVVKMMSVPELHEIKLLYQKEGLMGQVSVVEADDIVFSGTNRVLLVNRVIQTIETENGEVLPYINLISEAISTTEPETALLLGLGGGTLANVLIQNGFSVDAVEFDHRIANVAVNYFGLNSQVNVFIDDARRFINTSKKRYSLIVFDLFKGEEAPEHVITLESLEKVKKLLNHNGLIIINTHGFIDSEKGLGNLSLVKTLKEAGFKTALFTSNELSERRNIEILASINENVDNKINTHKIIISENDMKKAQVLTDKKPVLNYLNRKAARAWRKGYLEYLIKEINNRNVPVFS